MFEASYFGTKGSIVGLSLCGEPFDLVSYLAPYLALYLAPLCWARRRKCYNATVAVAWLYYLAGNGANRNRQQLMGQPVPIGQLLGLEPMRRAE